MAAKTRTRVGTLSFWMTGEGFTNVVRDLWDSNLITNVVGACSGLSLEDTIQICIGKAKFVGDTREGDHTLDIVKDNTKRYFTLERQIKILEDSFVYNTDRLSWLRRQQKLSRLPTIEAAVYRSNMKRYPNQTQYGRDEGTIQRCKTIANRNLEALSLLYPMAGKTMGDLPIDKIGNLLSDPEVRKSESAWEDMSIGMKLRQQEKAHGQIEEVQEEQEQIVPKPISIKGKDITDGWISPDGKFYQCGWQQHIQLSCDMREAGIVPEKECNEELWLENHGWLKLSANGFQLCNWRGDIASRRKLTNKQTDVMFDWWASHPDYKIKYNFETYDSTADVFEAIEENK